MLRKNFGQHGKSVFTAIFLIGRDEYDVFPPARAFLTGISKPKRAIRYGMFCMQSGGERRKNNSDQQGIPHFKLPGRG
jgi:hypothetical protein